jgi:lipid-A-disaccharide synthase
MPAPVIGIVAGEASGDLLGAHLIAALRAALPDARFIGVAGPKMVAAGAETLFPMQKLAVRGYVEVLRHYFEIVGIRRRLAERFLRERPALFIGIDAPDFNLDLEERLRGAGVPTVHYVSPAIWAWRAGRMRQIRRAVSKMLVVFPFEQALYERAGVPVAYVGHPLASLLSGFPDQSQAREQLRLPSGVPVVALLPGSRVSELENMAELFVGAARKIAEAVPEVLFLVPLVNRETRDLFEAALYRGGSGELALTMLFGHAHEAMAAADVALVASGTATLEAALLGRPMVITYRMPRLSWWIMNARRYQPYAGLPNILAGEFVVPELLQDAATADSLSRAVVGLLRDAAARKAMEARLRAIGGSLYRDTAREAAGAILPLLDGARP